MTRKNIFATILTPAEQPGGGKPGSSIARDHAADGAGRMSPAVGKLAQALDSVASRGIMELDPQLIDPSPYPDRLADDSSASFEAFCATIAAEGQKIPVQVRPHPTSPGRYQLAYGHRRWRAAAQLGKPLKAIVAALSDAELAVTQGLENSARQDLTWIERALFAARMDKQKVKARDIYASLGVDDAQLAHMRNVTKTLPHEIISLIGRAPKIGRRRWIELAEAYAQAPDAGEILKDILSADRSQSQNAKKENLSADRDLGSPSDRRFHLAFIALRKPAAPSPSPTASSWRAADGKPFGALKATADTINLTLDFRRNPGLTPRALELLAALKEELANSFSQSNRKG